MGDRIGLSWERERLLEALDAFQRGLNDAPLVRKWNEADVTAADDAQERPMAFVLSTDEIDRHGDIISADGWKLESYRSNPVFLWAHDYARPVIGRAVDTWTEPHRLMARVEFAPTQFASEVAMLYHAGYQRGVSVGFKPLRYEERRHEKTGALLGIRFLEQELLEASAVPVPANRNALRRALDEAPCVAEYLRRAAPMTETPGMGMAEIGMALEAMWPELSSRIDDLKKLAEELAETAAAVESTGSSNHSGSTVAELLAALKFAHPAAQLGRIQETWRDGEKRAILARFGGGDRTRVPYGKYSGLDPLDLACIRSLLTAQLREPSGLSPRMLEDWQVNLKAAMDSTTAGTGDELVDTQEARALWDDVNLETAIAPLFNTIQMPSNPFQIPLQLGDVNWYPGTENVASKSTALTTARQTLTAYQLVAEVPWSYDLDEDAVIAMMEELRRGLLRNAREVIDDVLLNGDTTTTNNINADGATIATTDAGKGHWLLGFDGLLHLPVVDNTSQANNHAGAVSDDMFNEIRAKLGKYGVRPSEVVYLTDVNTFIRSLSVANFRTLDKFGPQATVLTGQLGAVEGIPVIVSEQMKLADTDGKVTDAGNGTDTGRLLIVNRSQWRVGFKRELTIETVRDAQKRQNIMVVSFRIALQERTGTRSTATHTALQYNITGV